MAPVEVKQRSRMVYLVLRGTWVEQIWATKDQAEKAARTTQKDTTQNVTVTGRFLYGEEE